MNVEASNNERLKSLLCDQLRRTSKKERMDLLSNTPENNISMTKHIVLTRTQQSGTWSAERQMAKLLDITAK